VISGICYFLPAVCLLSLLFSGHLLHQYLPALTDVKNIVSKIFKTLKCKMMKIKFKTSVNAT